MVLAETILPKQSHRISLLCLSALLCLGLLAPKASYAQTASTYKRCVQHYRSKNFIKSSNCFADLAESIKKYAVGKLNNKQRRRRGRALRNAANAIKKGAPQEKNISKRSYLYEQGANYLGQYLKEKLYETKYIRRSAQYLQREFVSKTGRTTLSVVAGSPQAQIEVIGFRLKQSARGKWAQTVRPGTYNLTVTYFWSSKPLKRTVQVAPGTPKLVTLTPPKKPVVRRPTPRRIVKVIPPPRPRTGTGQKPNNGLAVARWVLIATGAAVATAGVITLAMGQSANTAAQTKFQAFDGKEDDAQLSDTRDILSNHSQAATLLPLGWTLSSVGLAGAIAGAALFAVPSTNNQDPPPPPSKNLKKGASVQF